MFLLLCLTQCACVSPSDEGVQWQKTPGKWNETDLDVSYERKPHHTYDSWFIYSYFLFYIILYVESWS